MYLSLYNLDLNPHLQGQVLHYLTLWHLNGMWVACLTCVSSMQPIYIKSQRNSIGRCWLGSSGSEQGPVAGSCENGNEHSHSLKDRGFLDKLSDF